MVFNSFEFVLFFPIVVAGHFALPQRWRWLWILIASYFFYMSWRPIYGLLLLGSTLAAYITGLLIARAATRLQRLIWLLTGVVCNAGVLFFFKYVDFANESLRTLAGSIGVPYPIPTLDVLLPMGISFFVFQNLGYTIDVYRGLAPERHVGRFLLFISFFPQLVAGPIERAKNLLPELRRHVRFDATAAVSGLRLMLWGMFKKVIIADRLSVIVDSVYDNPVGHSGSTLLIATYFFAFQIFCDFSGYTDIAIGAARVMGIGLMENFHRPYFADSVTDFWRRWHISLSTWFKDYLYFPLGGNRTSQARWCLNILIVFVVSGLWHGAAWTFVIWGALHGAYLVAEKTGPRFVPNAIRDWWAQWPTALRRVLASVVTFHLVLFAWVFFRARSFSDVVTILHAIGTLAPPDLGANPISSELILHGIAMILLLELVHAFQALPSERWSSWQPPVALRWGCYLAMLLAVLNLRPEYSAPFIYFRF